MPARRENVPHCGIVSLVVGGGEGGRGGGLGLRR